MSKVTLEDWNTWFFLTKNLYLPIELDIEEGEHDLYTYEWSEPFGTLSLKFNFSHNWHFYNANDEEITHIIGGDISKSDYGTVVRVSEHMSKFKGELDIIDNWQHSMPSGKMITPITKMFGYYFNDSLPTRFYFEKGGYDANFIRADFNEDDLPPLYPIIEDETGTYVDGEILTAKRIMVDMIDYKYVYPNMILAYEPPIITVNEPFYIGNINQLSDKLTLSYDVDYTVYYHNKPVTEILIDEDSDITEATVKVVTKSEYPYLPSEQFITIPIAYKEYEQLSDLDEYSYLKLESEEEHQEILFNGNVTFFSETGNGGFSDSSISISENANVLFKNIHINKSNIFNKGVLTFKGGLLESLVDDMVIVNDGTLIIEDASITQRISIINKGNIIIKNTMITMTDLKSSDLPFIHNNGSYELLNNNINFNGEYDGFNVAFIRANDIDTNQLQKNNNFIYDGSLTLDEVNYSVTGNGFAYAIIDDDTIRFKDLEVTEQ